MRAINPQETRTYTRIQNPRRARFVRILWLVVAVITLLIYFVGFLDFPKVLWRGMPLIDQSILVAQINDVVITQPSDALIAAGIHEGDKLLAVNANTELVAELLDSLDESDSSRLLHFPTKCDCFGAVGETVELRLNSGGEERSVSLLMETPNNLMVRAFTKLGFSLNAAAIFVLIIEVIYALFFLAMAVLIFRSRSDDWMALLVASSLLFLGLSTGLASHLDSVVISSQYFRFVIFASGIVIYAAAYFFPEGRIAPRWTLIFFVLYLTQLPISFLVDIPYRPQALSLFISISYIGSVLGLLFTLGYRYRYLFTREQKQQSKWMILGLAALIIGLIVVNSQRILVRSGYAEIANLYFALSFPLQKILSLGLPVGVAFAIMQYRLWEIDLVLNRSVVVLVVTLLLGGIFAAVFMFSQTLITSLIGTDGSGIAAGMSAIVAGFAFNPARQQVQHFIDRNLFRLRFDLNQLNAAQVRPTQIGILSGQRVNDLLFAEIIGRGGMGEVYKGYQGEKPVAIKTLRADVISDEKARERFMREGKLALKHPNIASVIDVGEADGINYIVMDYIEGKTLKEHLIDGAIDLDSAIEISCDICAALQAAHDAGLVHRDIKPANIILRPKPDGETYQAVVTDFGVAKWRSAKTELTGTGAIGTIDYMSPEQIRTSRSIDGRADIYAVGVVLYEMLTGERPFTGSLANVLFSHLNQPPPDILKVRQGIPVSIALSIIRAMSKEASDRYDSATKFAEALKK